MLTHEEEKNFATRKCFKLIKDAAEEYNENTSEPINMWKILCGDLPTQNTLYLKRKLSYTKCIGNLFYL